MHGNLANRVGGLQGTESENDPAWERIHELLRILFPGKTAADLADITGLSISGWHKSLREKRALSPDALLCLLRQPFGREILDALMGGSDARWYAEYRLMWDEAQLEARRQELQRRREALREKP